MSQAVFEVLNRYGETDQSNVWRVQNAVVIKHACLERVAAKARIMFDLPTILRAERDEAVILVSGHLDKRSDWSIGEALIGSNYRVSGKQAAYVYAMAEKRAKDRVILKLINLHGLAYSEEEADEFREQRQTEKQDAASPTSHISRQEEGSPFDDVLETQAGARDRLMKEWRAYISKFNSTRDLALWWNGDARKKATKDFDLPTSDLEDLKAAVIARKAEIERRVAA